MKDRVERPTNWCLQKERMGKRQYIKGRKICWAEEDTTSQIQVAQHIPSKRKIEEFHTTKHVKTVENTFGYWIHFQTQNLRVKKLQYPSLCPLPLKSCIFLYNLYVNIKKAFALREQWPKDVQFSEKEIAKPIDTWKDSQSY